MSYNIALNFEDGVTRFISCKEDETVLDAAYRHQINLSMDCSDGVCGACKGTCSEGDYDLGEEYLDEALSDLEKNQRKILTCQMLPQTDCVIEIPAASHLCKTGVQKHTAQVTKLEQLSASSLELTLALEQGINFLPGQYVNLEVPGSSGQVRAYSFTSLPGSSDASFLIRNVPNGLMSTWLTQTAQPGAQLELTGPQGIFYLRKVERPVLMLAGGTGLAPFLSMLELLKTTGCDHPVHLIYGVTQDEDLVCVATLEQLAAELPWFSFKTVVASAESSHPRKGYVTQHMEDAPLQDGNVDIYLCGPPAMVDAVMHYLDSENLQPNSFHYERFTPSVTKEAAAS